VNITEIYRPSPDVTLYRGDCLDILPTLAGVDAVITDPPYGLGDLWAGGGGGAKTSWKFPVSAAKSFDMTTADGVEKLADLAAQVIIWGGNYYRLPPSRCWLIWDKKQNDQWTTGQAEMAWTNLDRPVRVFRLAQCEQANEGPKDHPTQKPFRLMVWCMKWIAEGATVLDPYMGSGTTGVACIRTGRRFIGIEIDPTHYATACRRIDDELQRIRLPFAEVAA